MVQPHEAMNKLIGQISGPGGIVPGLLDGLVVEGEFPRIPLLRLMVALGGVGAGTAMYTVSTGSYLDGFLQTPDLTRAYKQAWCGKSHVSSEILNANAELRIRR